MSAQRKGKILGVVLLAVLSLARAQTKSPNTEPALSRDSPLLRIDLNNYGYPHHVAGRRDTLSLAFAGSNDLLVAWATLDHPGSDKKMGPLTSAPSHLHALLLDARTGQIKSVREWPTSSFYATVNPVAGHKFLICEGDALRLLSSDFALIREQRPLPPGACISMEFSPTRRSFSLNSGLGKSYQQTLLETESFQPLATWSNEAKRVQFSDTFLVGICSQYRELCIRKLDQPWKSFVIAGMEMDQQIKASKEKALFFINNETLVLATAKELAAVTAEGALLFQVNLPDGYLVGAGATSDGDGRFAIIETRMRGLTNERLDMYAFPSDDHVTVFSVHDRMAIYTRKVKGTSPWAPWDGHTNILALSRDGSLLALIDEGILDVYQLPASK